MHHFPRPAVQAFVLVSPNGRIDSFVRICSLLQVALVEVAGYLFWCKVWVMNVELGVEWSVGWTPLFYLHRAGE